MAVNFAKLPELLRRLIGAANVAGLVRKLLDSRAHLIYNFAGSEKTS